MTTTDLVRTCSHCGNCTRICAFLKKYDLDLDGFSRRPDLAFHCFLCRNCYTACPEKIDGRLVSLALRETLLTQPARRREMLAPYKWILAEKRDYIFRNYHSGSADTVFFPGCNLTGYMPRTTRRAMAFFRSHGIGTVIDCCAKPVWELEGRARGGKSLENLRDRLRKAGVKEVITACPNCYHFLKEHISVRITDIFSALKGLRHPIPDLREHPVFPPCPDRRERFMLRAARELFRRDLGMLAGAQCCGLGGGVWARDPELVEDLKAAVRTGQEGTLYVYCASCAAALNSAGCRDVRHLLAEVFGINERPRLGFSGLLHRCLFRFL